jgi:hypothetical protein
MNAVIVLAVLLVAVITFWREGAPTSRYGISVRSEPAGAAVFVNDQAANATTDGTVKIAAPGFYTIRIVKPGYRPLPPTVEVHVTEENPVPNASFSLYPETVDTSAGAPKPSDE